jgi:hypothetical protein
MAATVALERKQLFSNFSCQFLLCPATHHHHHSYGNIWGIFGFLLGCWPFVANVVVNKASTLDFCSDCFYLDSWKMGSKTL